MKNDKGSKDAFRLFEETAGKGPVINKDAVSGNKRKARPSGDADPHLLTVDLHGLNLEDALAQAGKAISRAGKGGYTSVRIITGIGKHSPGLYSPLNTGMEDYLTERKLDFKKSDGAFTVCLK